VEGQVGQVGNYLIIRMPKEVDHYQSEKIRKKTDKLLEDSRVEHIVFDFADTDFMDSSGLGVIAGRYQKVACFGGTVKAMHVSERIKRMLVLSGMLKLVEIVDKEMETDEE